MNTLRPLIFLQIIFFLGIVEVSAQQQPGKHFPRVKPGCENLVDTRIDNMVYWMNMLKKGYIEPTPTVEVMPAIYTSSKIHAPGVRTDDSPDVPVTGLNCTQSENSVFVNPNDNKNILNSNNSTPNPVGIIIYGATDFYSFDSGENWEGELEGAGGENFGDPATAISLDGRYYVGYISSNYGQGVSYSTDQGQTWTPVQVDVGGDKNHLWVDNSLSSPYQGYLYDTWTRIAAGSDYMEVAFKRSTDGGATWSPRIIISSAVNAGNMNQGVNIHTGPDGQVYAIWAIYDTWPSDETALGFARSFDGGVTFEPAVRIITNIKGIRTSETSKCMRVNSFPSMTVDISNSPDRGTIYAVWPNIGVPGVNAGSDIDVYMIKSSDQGNTWSAPVRINQDPAGLGKEHFFPWITCDPVYGTLNIIFYDDRNVSSFQCEVYCATSNNGGDSWEDFKVSDVAFTPSPIPNMAVNYMGDYLGITSLNRMVYPSWTDNRLGYCMTYVSPYVTGPPPNQPWVIFNSYTINDSQGNDNGEMDYGESILLNMTLKNIGDTPGSQINVTISSQSPYITFTDSTENFGDFAVDEAKTIDDAFAFEVSQYIPDGVQVAFKLKAVDMNDSVFTSTFKVVSHAPALVVSSITISDPTGNNNRRLDPGETADIRIGTSNPGSFDATGVMTTLATTFGYLTLNNTSFDLATVATGETGYAVFNVTVNAAAPIGTPASFIYVANGTVTSIEKDFILTIGIIVEDFETGNFDNFPWQFGGNAAWMITEGNVNEGSYCARSGQIGDISTSEMYLTYNVAGDDSISFYRKVSSEYTYDYLVFYIDSQMMDEWSGEVEWGRVVYPVTAGEHVFKWVYSKDYINSGGDDRAWIDYIVFPPEPRTWTYAGPDATTCENIGYMLQGVAEFYDSLEWTTSGTGTFDNNTILNPVYTPGSEDAAAGAVTLTLTVHGVTGEVSDDMVLTVNPQPGVYAGSDAEICDYQYFFLEQATAENTMGIEWSTSGDGTFDDPTIPNPVYIPGPGDISAGAVSLIMTGTQETCPDAADDMTLTIHSSAQPAISGSVAACLNNQEIYMNDSIPDYGYEWIVTGGTIMEGQDTHQITVNWDNPEGGQVVLLLTDLGTGCEKTDTLDVAIHALPEPDVSGETAVCQGSADVIYTTPSVEGDSYEWTVTGGEIVSSQNSNEINVTWGDAGTGTVGVMETTEATGCQAGSSMDVTINPLPVINLGNDTSICHNHILILNAGNPDALSWIWSTGETTQTIVVDSTGVGIGGTKVVSVTVTDAQGCEASDEISIYFQDCSGIPENAYGLEVKIFPNPNKGTFTLELDPEQNDIISVRIISASGSTVFEERNMHLTGKLMKELRLDNARDGIYYLFIDSDRIHAVKKVVIQR